MMIDRMKNDRIYGAKYNPVHLFWGAFNEKSFFFGCVENSIRIIFN